MSSHCVPYLLCLLLLGSCNNAHPDYSKWEHYAGTKDGIRYSSLSEIDTLNVADLQLAWEYSSGDKDSNGKSQIQCTPIVVDGILYGTTPTSKLFALDAANGVQKWMFDPSATEDSPDNTSFHISRGVAYWCKGEDRRIIYGAGEKLFAVNAKTGEMIKTFAGKGFIDLSKGLDRPGSFNPFVANTTPGIVYKDLIIVGTRVAESADAAPGDIRAFDIETGDVEWVFHTIPRPGEPGYETWPDKNAWKKLGGANCWAGMSVDEKRGIVYIPLGSVAGDFYGGIRKGQKPFRQLYCCARCINM